MLCNPLETCCLPGWPGIIKGQYQKVHNLEADPVYTPLWGISSRRGYGRKGGAIFSMQLLICASPFADHDADPHSGAASEDDHVVILSDGISGEQRNLKASSEIINIRNPLKETREKSIIEKSKDYLGILYICALNRRKFFNIYMGRRDQKATAPTQETEEAAFFTRPQVWGGGGSRWGRAMIKCKPLKSLMNLGRDLTRANLEALSLPEQSAIDQNDFYNLEVVP